MTTGNTFTNLCVISKHNNGSHNCGKINEGRVVVEINNLVKSCHLKITHTTAEDTGRYFCGVAGIDSPEFGPGTFLEIQGNSSFFVRAIRA